MGIVKRLEEMFAAVAFAEAGEHETAKEIVKKAEEGSGTVERPSGGLVAERE